MSLSGAQLQPSQPCSTGVLRDTAGQERFNSITSAYYRSAKGIILVYDITKKETFDDLPKWMKMIDKYASEDAELLLVGNKLDCETDREISRQQGEKVREWGLSQAAPAICSVSTHCPSRAARGPWVPHSSAQSHPSHYSFFVFILKQKAKAH